MTTAIEIVEVAPRDGLQNERTILPTATKVELVQRSVDAGLRRIEVTSFARPDRVPQLADAEAVLAGVARANGVRLSALVLNRRGLDRAIAAGVDEINYVLLCTETFSQRNQGLARADSMRTWLDVAAVARANALPATVTFSAAFGCPFEGELGPETVLPLVEQALAGGPAEVALADTIGVGVPAQVRTLVDGCRRLSPTTPLRMHLHDTRRTGIANALAAVEAGVTVLDASAGGVGGCPFAPQATGNIATEDVLYALHRSGYRTGVDPLAVAATGTWLADQLGLAETPGALGRAGWFGPL